MGVSLYDLYQREQDKKRGTAPPDTAKAGSLYDQFQAQRGGDPAPSPAPRSTLYNVVNTVDNALTLGLGPKFNAAFTAAGDMIRGRDSFGHSFTKNVEADQSGLSTLANERPYSTAGLSALGTSAGIIAAAPLQAARAAAAPVSAAIGGATTAAGRMLSAGGSAAKAGATFGAVNALGNAPNSGTPLDQLVTAGKGAALGGGIGGVLGAGGAAVGPAVTALSRTGSRVRQALGGLFGGDAAAAARVPTQATARIAGPVSTPQSGPVNGALASSVDRASLILLRRLIRAGMTPQAALDAVAQIPVDKPVSVMEVAGAKSQPVRELGKWVARTPSTGAADLRANVEQRATPLPNAQRVLGDVADAMGADRTNLVKHTNALRSQQQAAAAPHFETAFQSGPVPLESRVDVEAPTLNDLMKRPSMRSALKFHNEIAAERGHEPIEIPGAGEISDQAAPIRDKFGNLRRNLSSVADDDLQSEWQRLAELIGKEEHEHGAAQEAGYREDYYALPETERLGESRAKAGQRTGKKTSNLRGSRLEDLPDADGMVDPDVLAEDNRTVSSFNQRQIIRQARAQAMQRIEAEQAKRQGSATDFPFGEHEPAPTGIALKSLQSMKFALDEMLGFAEQHGRLPDGSAATKERLGAINQTRRDLLGIMTQHSPDYAKGNASFAGDAARQNAVDAGRKFLSRPISELQAEYPTLGPGEQQQHNIGAVGGPIRDRLFNTSAVDRAKILNGPDIQERLQVVASPEGRARLARNAGTEHEIATTHQQLPGGSDTQGNIANDADVRATQEAIGKGVFNVLVGRPIAAAKSALEPAMDRYWRGITEQTANALSPQLSAGMISRQDLIDLLEQLAARNDKLARLRMTSTPLLGGAAGASAGQLPSRRNQP